MIFDKKPKQFKDESISKSDGRIIGYSQKKKMSLNSYLTLYTKINL